MTTELERHAESHDKQRTILEFLDWVRSEHRAMLMTWVETDEEHHCTGWGISECAYDDSCRKCKGTLVEVRHHEGYFNLRVPSEHLVQDFFGVDRDKLEEERRALLDEIRSMNDV